MKCNAALCWIFMAPLLTGVLILGVLVTPGLECQATLYIPVAALLGFVYGAPLARSISKFIDGPIGRDPALRWGWGL